MPIKCEINPNRWCDCARVGLDGECVPPKPGDVNALTTQVVGSLQLLDTLNRALDASEHGRGAQCHKLIEDACVQAAQLGQTLDDLITAGKAHMQRAEKLAELLTHVRNTWALHGISAELEARINAALRKEPR